MGHWVESGLTAIIAFLPCAALGVHVMTFSVYGAIQAWAIVLHHSGYEFLPDTVPCLGLDSMVRQHDDHHKHFEICYGVSGILDKILGTDHVPHNTKRA